MFFLAVLEEKSVRWSDPLLATSCTSSRIYAFLLALHCGCEGKGKAASLPSFQGTGGAQGITYSVTLQPQSGRCLPCLGNLSCFSCWNGSVCMDLPSFESLSWGRQKAAP